MSGFFDPMNHYKAKSKLKEFEKLIEQYNEIYKATSEELEAVYKAKIYAVTIIKEVENYINSIANTPKEYKSIVFSINVKKNNYKNTYDDIKKEKEKKDKIGDSIVVAVSVAAILGGPIAWGVDLVTVGIACKKKKEHNVNTIEKIDGEINKIRKEITNLNSKDNEFITEKEYIYKHVEYIKENFDEVKKTGIKDYSKFSSDQKRILGVIVTNINELINRLDGSV